MHKNPETYSDSFAVRKISDTDFLFGSFRKERSEVDVPSVVQRSSLYIKSIVFNRANLKANPK